MNIPAARNTSSDGIPNRNPALTIIMLKISMAEPIIRMFSVVSSIALKKRPFWRQKVLNKILYQRL